MANYGGIRKGAGRKKLTDEQRFEKYQENARIFTDEVMFPAICQAMNAEPGQFGERRLKVELSKTDIKLAYGKDALDCWMGWFKEEKRGGCDRFGKGYKTQWSLSMGSWTCVVKLIKSLGHSLKDLPQPGFPPKAMQDRLNAKRKNNDLSALV